MTGHLVFRLCVTLVAVLSLTAVNVALYVTGRTGGGLAFTAAVTVASAVLGAWCAAAPEVP